MPIIALTNQKGGVGKTTTTVNLASGLAMRGQRVLVVDLDPQANATAGLGFEADGLERTVYDVLAGVARISNVLQRRPLDGVAEGAHIDLVPSSIALSSADLELGGRMGRESLLKTALNTIREAYDFILIDCPPNLGILTVNALVAADEVYIVSNVEFYAMQGMTNLIDAVDQVRQFYNDKLAITGLVPTHFDSRKNLNREVLERFQEHFDGQIFDVAIRDNVTLAEAPSHGLTIFEYDARSHGAEDYTSLTDEVIGRYA